MEENIFKVPVIIVAIKNVKDSAEILKYVKMLLESKGIDSVVLTAGDVFELRRFLVQKKNCAEFVIADIGLAELFIKDGTSFPLDIKYLLVGESLDIFSVRYSRLPSEAFVFTDLNEWTRAITKIINKQYLSDE